LHQLNGLVEELRAIANNLPPINAALRKYLFATPSLGGARPKATLKDKDAYWLVKPGLATDTVDLALLEHVTQRWGHHAGMRFAHTEHHAMTNNRSVVRVLRFDRQNDRRILAVSGASLLQVEYPPVAQGDSEGASYPRLAEELRRIGAPREDWREMFDRMVFNAVVGNDDDHPRNHAVVYDNDAKGWRLSPAFDVVPNPDEVPKRLVMQLCSGNWTISRANLTRDFLKFGFLTQEEAEVHLDELLVRIQSGFEQVSSLLSAELYELMSARLSANCALLQAPEEIAKNPSDFAVVTEDSNVHVSEDEHNPAGDETGQETGCSRPRM
jgi:serine/threonine-protein kinase HipA